MPPAVAEAFFTVHIFSSVAEPSVTPVSLAVLERETLSPGFPLGMTSYSTLRYLLSGTVRVRRVRVPPSLSTCSIFDE